ncbi:MAG TPA: VOC family protein [Stellaceae bacterium]|nr:VOC family protein [Stellaceae bacterium]
MTDTPVTHAPHGMHTVTPSLVCAGAAEAIDFYRRAFGAEEMIRLPLPNGKLMHASLRIGDSVVMLTDENPSYNVFGPKSLNGTPVSIHLFVDDVDSFTARAVAAGATLTMPIADMFWGDRFCMIEDPFGHRWSIGTHLRDVSADEMRQGALKMSA